LGDLEEIKEEITNLVFTGKKDEAISLLQKKYNINREEAEKLLTLALKETINPGILLKRIPQMLSGGKGCKKTIYGMVAFGFGFFGIPMLLAAIGFGIYFHYDANQRIEITGTVVDYDTYYDANGVLQHSPIISYTVDGKVYSCKGTMYNATPEYNLEDTVVLQVSPDDPESVYIDSFSERWFVIGILGSVSFFLIILMFLFTFMSRKL
jgi:hypothetical protein